MSEEFSLERLRQALSRILEAESGVAAVYLYGSRAGGRVLPSSDLDLAVVLSDPESAKDPLFAERIAARLADELETGIEIDAHLADHLPLPVRGRVVTEGVLVYEAEPIQRVEFETSTRRLYFDFLPLLERDAREGIMAGG